MTVLNGRESFFFLRDRLLRGGGVHIEQPAGSTSTHIGVSRLRGF